MTLIRRARLGVRRGKRGFRSARLSSGSGRFCGVHRSAPAGRQYGGWWERVRPSFIGVRRRKPGYTGAGGGRSSGGDRPFRGREAQGDRTNRGRGSQGERPYGPRSERPVGRAGGSTGKPPWGRGESSGSRGSSGPRDSYDRSGASGRTGTPSRGRPDDRGRPQRGGAPSGRTWGGAGRGSNATRSGAGPRASDGYRSGPREGGGSGYRSAPREGGGSGYRSGPRASGGSDGYRTGPRSASGGGYQGSAPRSGERDGYRAGVPRTGYRGNAPQSGYRGKAPQSGSRDGYRGSAPRDGARGAPGRGGRGGAGGRDSNWSRDTNRGVAGRPNSNPRRDDGRTTPGYPAPKISGWGGVARKGASAVRRSDEEWAERRDDRRPPGPARRTEEWSAEAWVEDSPRRRKKPAPKIDTGPRTFAPPEPLRGNLRPVKLPGAVGAELSAAAGPSRAPRLAQRLGEATRAYERDRYEEARRVLKPLADEAPASAAVRELFGLTLYRMGRWRDAIKQLEAFHALSGSFDQHPTRMDCYRALGRHAQVDELWLDLGEASPSAELMTEGRIVKAGSLADRGDLGEAVRTLDARGQEDRPAPSLPFTALVRPGRPVRAGR